MPDIIMRLAILALLFVVRIHECLCAEKNFCGPPPNIQGATISNLGENQHHGKVITYTCNFGYLTEGTGENAECVRSRNGRELEWTHPGITCVPRSCGFPGFVRYATRNGSRFTYPNSVSFECEEGYTLVGPKQRFCQTNGQWSGRLPTCERITCPEPQSIDNGRTVFFSLEFGSELNYECEKGYLLSKRDTRFCSMNGDWSGNEPECLEAHCNIPDPPEFGTKELVGNEAKVGSIILFTCDKGRDLVGSRNTKCLETGQWTFPPPTCVEPCNIPQIPDGELGIYERKYRRVIYRKLTVGELVEDDKELSFKCKKNFQPSGMSATDIKVTCRHGQWSHDLQCIPASCSPLPPPVPNSRVGSISTQHGGTVVYLCNKDFIKVKTGAVKCEFGEWMGPTPICQDTRCSREDLNFPGLSQEGKFRYSSGESYIPTCMKGYELSRPGNEMLRCDKGQWKGHLQPCKGAACTNPPPVTKHGYSTAVHQVDHGLFAHYDCEPPYFLAETGTIQCHLGEWRGSSPMCKDSRCYQKDIKFNRGIILISSDVTHSEKQAAIQCEEGFELKYAVPKCLDGTWIEQQVSPCARKGCLIPSINHGQITTRTKSNPTWNWRRFRYETHFTFTGAKIGSLYHDRTEYFITCNPGFSVQGIPSANHVATDCNTSHWMPEPVCLRPGAVFIPSTRRPTPTTSKLLIADQDALRQSEKNEEEEIPRTLPSSTISDPTEPEESITTPFHEIFNDTCSCKYNLKDPNLQAYSEDELLSFGSKVKDGGIVRFYCTFYKFSKLMGPKEVECRDCRSWHSSEFPTCVDPVEGDVIILWLQKENTLSVLPTGELSAVPESNLSIMCTVLNGTNYAVWAVPEIADVKVKYNAIDLDGGYVLVSTIELNRVRSSHEGIYECSGGQRGPRRIHITIPPKPDYIEFCHDIVTDGSVLVEYEDQRKIHSKALFRCKSSDQQMHGVDSITCLPNGFWADDPPKCNDADEESVISYCVTPGSIDNGKWIVTTELENLEELPERTKIFYSCNEGYTIKGKELLTCEANGYWSDENPICVTDIECPALEETNNLKISYTENGKVGSKATFRCLTPFVRRGPQQISCLSNGSWSGSAPVCINVECPALRETDNLRISYTENGKVGSFATFHCLSPFVRRGANQIVCLSNGSWSGPVSVCISKSTNTNTECPLLIETDNLKISYTEKGKIGSKATFYCFPPFIRKGPMQISCLRNGSWSGPASVCITPSCLVEDLFSEMPEGVVPNVDDILNETMPYESVVRIGCDSPNLILVEGKTVSCGYAGKWEVGRVRCVPGCKPIEKPVDSELIIEPNKEFYRFGEFTMFSCPPEYELSSEVERVMCLRSGWSQEIVPVCRKL